MKLCLSARQNIKYLDLADEIIFEYRDRDAIPDFIKKYPEKTIILTCFEKLEDIDWDQIQNYNILAKEDHFILRIIDLKLIDTCNFYEILYYFAYPITSYDELNAVLSMGSYYVRLGAPLFFDLDNIKKYFPKIKIRALPNIAYDDSYIRNNGVAGTWIRPEDLLMYDDYIDVIEFQDANPQKEQALVRIYWQNREWPGDLRTLITNLQYSGVNYLLSSEITEKRLNCRQMCMANHKCKICHTMLQLANPSLLEEYKKAIDLNDLEPLEK